VPGGPKAHRKTQAGISRKPGPEFPRISGCVEVLVGKAQAPKFFTGRLPAIEMPRARAGPTRSLRPRARPGSESLAGPARGLRTVLVRWYY
jgi:hypothetical protein